MMQWLSEAIVNRVSYVRLMQVQYLKIITILKPVFTKMSYS